MLQGWPATFYILAEYTQRVNSAFSVQFQDTAVNKIVSACRTVSISGSRTFSRGLEKKKCFVNWDIFCHTFCPSSLIYLHVVSILINWTRLMGHACGMFEVQRVAVSFSSTIGNLGIGVEGFRLSDLCKAFV